MELVAKIFETLDITQLALFQMGLAIVLAFALSATLIKPIVRIFEERENRSVRPLEESRRLQAEAEAKVKGYNDAFRKASAEALAAKRARIEETSRAERRKIEAAAEESSRTFEAMRGRIAVERDAASRELAAGMEGLSREIAVKVLGRPVA